MLLTNSVNSMFCTFAYRLIDQGFWNGTYGGSYREFDSWDNDQDKNLGCFGH